MGPKNQCTQNEEDDLVYPQNEIQMLRPFRNGRTNAKRKGVNENSWITVENGGKSQFNIQF